LVLPIIIGYYLFFVNPQVQFTANVQTQGHSVNITSYNITQNDINEIPTAIVHLGGPYTVAAGGPIGFLRTLFSSAPGFNVYLGCFTDGSTFNPPTNSSQKITMYLTTNENKTYAIGKIGNTTCIPIEAGTNFSAQVSWKAQLPIRLHPGTSVFIQAIPIFGPRIDYWSTFAKVLLFLLAWDTVGVLIYEVFKKLYQTKS